MKSRWVLFHLGNLIPNSFHTLDAILQSHRAWAEDSFPPHAAHLSSTVTFLLAKQWFVGNISLQARHRKCLILFGHSSVHIDFQRFVIFEASEQSPPVMVPFFSFNTLIATPYALFTVNFPLLVYAHILESSGRLRLIGIPRITSAS